MVEHATIDFDNKRIRGVPLSWTARMVYSSVKEQMCEPEMMAYEEPYRHYDIEQTHRTLHAVELRPGWAIDGMRDSKVVVDSQGREVRG